MNKIKIFACAIASLVLVSCSTIQSTLQITQCSYNYAGVVRPRVAGVDISRISNISQINAMDVMGIASAFLQKRMPLDVVINIKATNPGSVVASIIGFAWAIDYEGKEMLHGTINNPIRVPANGGTTIIPLSIGVDLFELFAGQSQRQMLNFALDIANADKQSSKVSLRLSPSISIAGQPLPISLDFVRVNF